MLFIFSLFNLSFADQQTYFQGNFSSDVEVRSRNKIWTQVVFPINLSSHPFQVIWGLALTPGFPNNTRQEFSMWGPCALPTGENSRQGQLMSCLQSWAGEEPLVSTREESTSAVWLFQGRAVAPVVHVPVLGALSATILCQQFTNQKTIRYVSKSENNLWMRRLLVIPSVKLNRHIHAFYKCVLKLF